MKDLYKAAELDVIKFEAEDVITASVDALALGGDNAGVSPNPTNYG